MDQLAAETDHNRPNTDRPDLAVLLEIDREYRQKLQDNSLPFVELPGHSNQFRPVLCRKYDEWRLTVRYGASPDEVIVYCRHLARATVRCAWVKTARIGGVAGKRIIRGRRIECAQHYRRLSPAAPGLIPWRSVGVASLILLGVPIFAKSSTWSGGDPTVFPVVAAQEANSSTTPVARSRTRVPRNTSIDKGVAVVVADDLLTVRALDTPLTNPLATNADGADVRLVLNGDPAAAVSAAITDVPISKGLQRLPNGTSSAMRYVPAADDEYLATQYAQHDPAARVTLAASAPTVTGGEFPTNIESTGTAFDVAQVTPSVDTPPVAIQPQPAATAGTGTKYVWGPRQFVSDLIPGFQLGRWGGQLEGYFDDSRTDTDNPNARLRSEDRLYDTRLTIRNSGAYIIDPRLLRLSLGATVGIIKQEFDITSASSTVQQDSDDSDLLGYDFSAHVLPRNSFSVDLFANRNRLTESGSLAGRLLTDLRNAGVTVKARRFYIPSTLSFRTNRTETESGTTDLVTSRRDERRQSIIYDGRRGWLNRALRLRYRSIDSSDPFTPSTDFKSHEGQVFYTMDFGPELRKRWDSNFRVFDRTGITDDTRLDLDQQVQIDHTDRLRTRYRYESSFTDRPVGDTDTHTASFLLGHKLYESLNTTLELTNSRDSFPGGERDIRRGRLEFDYDKELPNAQLSAGLALFKERQDDDFETTLGFVSREPHRFDESFALPISLNEPFVAPGSVLIIKTRNGPDVAGCGSFSVPRPLVEGIDYTLRNIGDLIEIVPLPCSLTTPGINPADTITVDYRVTVNAAVGIDTNGYDFNVEIDHGHFRPFYRRTERDQAFASGFDSRILNDRETEVFGVDVRYATKKTRIQLRVQHEDSKSRDQESESTSVSPSLHFNYNRRWRLSANARLRERRFSRPRDRLEDLWAIRADLTYTRDANFRVEWFGEVRDLQDSQVPDDHIEEIGMRARWRLGKLDVVPTLRYIDRRRGATDLRDRRATLRVIRRF